MKSTEVINGKKLKGILSSNFSNIVSEVVDYNIVNAPALSLLNYRRLDILAKYIYSDLHTRDIQTNFSKDIYTEHIKAFNNFVENDESQKVGPKAFLTAFDNVIDSLEKNRYMAGNPIPVSRDGIILDGAHRLGASLALNIPVSTVTLDVTGPTYDYNFFKSRGFSEENLGFLASSYARLKNTSRVICIWPRAQGKDAELTNIVKKYSDIVYKRRLVLTRRGELNIMRVCYSQEPWLGCVSDGFMGAKSKSDQCFGGASELRIYLVDPKADLLDMKEEIRRLYNVGKHSVHVNDTHEETIELIESLFNQNSLNLLNTQEPQFFKKFDSLQDKFLDWINSSQYNLSDFCIDGSGTLAVYGVRDVNDLDLISSINNIPVIGEDIDVSDVKRKYHEYSVNELIHNPNNHLFYEGVKYISLDALKRFKERRASPNDLEDIHLISNLLSCQPLSLPLKLKIRKWFNPRFIFGKCKLTAIKIRYIIKKNKIGWVRHQ